MFNII